MGFKKNTTNQILFILTKSGDNSHAKGATVSQITAGGPSYVLVSAGSAVAGKGTISKAASLVKSGVFRQTLKADECNGDMGLYLFTATSCALQFIPVTFEGNTPAEVYSRALLVASLASDTHSQAILATSAARAANSRALLVQSLASDAQSGAAAAYSRCVLATSAAREASSRALLIQSLASDAVSAARAVTVSIGASDVSIIASVVASAVLAAGVGGDNASQIWAYSDAAATKSAAEQANNRALVIQSLVSDTHSQAARTYSAVAAGAGGATPSEVWAYSDAVAVLSAARGAGSRVLVVQSLASDAVVAAILAVSAAREGSSRVLVVQSLASDTHSQAARAYSAVVAIGSDLESQVSAATSAARAAASRALVVQSLASDAQSQAERTYSAVAAGLGGATPSAVWAYSDAAAALSAARQTNARVLIVQSLASDAQSGAAAAYSRCVLATSAARQGSSRALVVQSLVSDTHSVAVQASSRALVVQSMVSDIHSLVQDVPTAAENADALLGRNIAGGSDGGRTLTGALRTLRNKIDTVTVPGKAIIYREDDVTEDHRRDLTTDASALPIVTADPTT